MAIRFEVKSISLFWSPWPHYQPTLGRFFSHLPIRQVLLAPLAALSFQVSIHVHPRCGHGSRQVGWEPEGSRADWEKESGKQEWATVKKRWWRTEVNRRLLGELPRLKPLEANTRERDRVEGCRGQAQGNWEFTLVLSGPWGPLQTLVCTAPATPNWREVKLDCCELQIIQHRNL